MAEFCSLCSPWEDKGDWDYDLRKIAKKLKKGHSYNILCEGCDVRGIYKDEFGDVYFGHKKKDNIVLKKIDISILPEKPFSFFGLFSFYN